MNSFDRSGRAAGPSKAEKAYAALMDPSVLVLTTSETAIILRYTQRHVINLIAEGVLDALPKELGKWRLLKSSVRKYVGLPPDDEPMGGIPAALPSPGDIPPRQGNIAINGARVS